jgi:hypothetical protein
MIYTVGTRLGALSRAEEIKHETLNYTLILEAAILTYRNLKVKD